jgi:hypothetical protein
MDQDPPPWRFFQAGDEWVMNKIVPATVHGFGTRGGTVDNASERGKAKNNRIINLLVGEKLNT